MCKDKAPPHLWILTLEFLTALCFFPASGYEAYCVHEGEKEAEAGEREAREGGEWTDWCTVNLLFRIIDSSALLVNNSLVNFWGLDYLPIRMEAFGLEAIFESTIYSQISEVFMMLPAVTEGVRVGIFHPWTILFLFILFLKALFGKKGKKKRHSSQKTVVYTTITPWN